jgi:endonuclease VIII
MAHISDGLASPRAASASLAFRLVGALRSASLHLARQPADLGTGIAQPPPRCGSGSRCVLRESPWVPEGHTIHRHARQHQRLFKGQELAVSSPQGRFAGVDDVHGQHLVRTEAFGKHEFLWFTNDLAVHVHLGLFGKWRTHRVSPPPLPRGQVRMRLSGDEATADLSGPTACAVLTKEGRDAIVARLGPDPIRTDSDPQRFFDRVARSRQSIGQLLMDQSVIAGVGNVYRAEALFVNGIWPERAGRDLVDAEREALWTTSVVMLRKGVKEGRIVTVERDEARGGRDKQTYVYKRGECLRCGTAVLRWDMAGRWCYACPTCQPK